MRIDDVTEVLLADGDWHSVDRLDGPKSDIVPATTTFEFGQFRLSSEVNYNEEDVHEFGGDEEGFQFREHGRVVTGRLSAILAVRGKA